MWHRIFSSLTENTYFRATDGVLLELLGVLLVLVCVLYLLEGRKRQKLPPGPIGLPIFGYYFFLGKKPERKLYEVGKKFGNVFGFYIGSQYIVFLNDWEAMKEAMKQTATVDRPSSLFSEVPYNFGIAGANGEEWIHTRRLVSRSMKDIGLHDTRWEELIEEEATEMVQRITQEGQHPIDVRRLFCESFANNILALILGERLPARNLAAKIVAESIDTVIEHTPTLGMMNFSPMLSRILQMLGLEKKSPLSEKAQELAKLVSNMVDEIIRNPKGETEDSFIARYFKEVRNPQKNKDSIYFTEDTLKGNVTVLLSGGTETSRTSIIWELIAMADHPDIQRKVHEELDRVIGKEGSIRWSDRFKIPYTFATLLESMRWATVVPFTTMRIVTEDTQIQGYHIPKGTFLTANTWSLHNDPKYWDKPEQFIPERFLLEGGRKVNTAADSFNPFSYGKRICPGKLIALMENLQYFAVLMQNFEVLPQGDGKVKYNTLLGLTYQATDVRLRFIPRKQKA